MRILAIPPQGDRLEVPGRGMTSASKIYWYCLNVHSFIQNWLYIKIQVILMPIWRRLCAKKSYSFWFFLIDLFLAFQIPIQHIFFVLTPPIEKWPKFDTPYKKIDLPIQKMTKIWSPLYKKWRNFVKNDKTWSTMAKIWPPIQKMAKIWPSCTKKCKNLTPHSIHFFLFPHTKNDIFEIPHTKNCIFETTIQKQAFSRRPHEKWHF